MLSFETLYVEIGQVDFSDIRLFVFCRDGSLQKCFLTITQKVLGAHKKNVQILIPLVESFHLSYVRALCAEV